MSQFFNPTGYNKADLQFHEHDERLLQELRGRLDTHRNEVAAKNAKSAYWMKCPKCGQDMKEVHLHLKEVKSRDVVVDQCPKCGGVYFDAGELAILIGPDPRSHKLIERLFSWLPRYQEAVDLLWPRKK
ncbi:MAG: zf-TFIIB domain-containing protein [Planctomycetes bacterium]|nr:zf-TFIIB domain-containing protein [Planctomycetota bacterium]